MKSAGLSSTYRTMLRKTTRRLAFASLQEKHFAAKAEQNAHRVKAAQAQFERQKKQNELFLKAHSVVSLGTENLK
jgi:hypothetical protein